jgi:carboxypeptidase-like protein/TonB-dependent receptor-like protein
MLNTQLPFRLRMKPRWPCSPAGPPSFTSIRAAALGTAACALVAVAPASAQDENQVGSAIVQACGQVDEATEGVLSGTVRDQESGVSLDGATVVIEWRIPGETRPGTASTVADLEGFFLFCHAPGGTAVDLYADALGRRSQRIRVEIESGTLQVEHVEVRASDPSQPGFVTGRVVDRTMGTGIANAEVRVRGPDLWTLTNDRGLFTLDEMPYGVYVLEVEHLAYQAREIPLNVSGGVTQNVEIQLSEEAMELEGLTVSVEPRKFYNDMEGLVHRIEIGFGDFLMREDIERRGATKLPELLVGLPGVRMTNNGDSLVVRGRKCWPMVFIDGRLYKLDPDQGLNDVSTFDLEAVEFYKGTASIPSEFNFSNNESVGCGAIVVWTRRGR